MDKITECVYRVYKVTDKIYKLCGVTNDDNWDINKKYFDSSVKIIGHDIMLNDVLEWFRFMNSEGEEPFCYFTIDTNGNIIFDKFDEKTMSLYWDLSSPCLKDQREELIKFSYNIAKDE